MKNKTFSFNYLIIVSVILLSIPAVIGGFVKLSEDNTIMVAQGEKPPVECPAPSEPIVVTKN